ncbi:hypothetical protein UCRNP2_10230 [Neofusicoccum parvum UCRNP2]|uniref:Sur7 protein n=1 Tax=Botryosphaeria parva (strain UCR-NP2) TaxID=1287680 RepID=R1E5X2_BOTPV|nr:hypothetical protein UCRNP2_10230 [Neofusicoccum parvum UCRNP2]
MAFPYRGLNNKKTRRAPKANGGTGKFPKKKKASSRHILGVLSVLLWLTALILGVFTLVGCISPNMEKLYVAELGTNDTYNVNFRVGFFGGCLSMTNTTNGVGISDNSSQTSHTQCVVNMRIKDNDDLSDQLLDDWTVTDAAKAELNSSLTKTITLARHLQNDVFPASPPTAHVILLLISGILLFALSTNQSGKRGYKVALVMGVLCGAFALALVFLASIGALRSLNALVDGDWSIKMQSLGGDDVTVNRAGRLWYLQLAQVVLVSAVYILMGLMFV